MSRRSVKPLAGSVRLATFAGSAPKRLARTGEDGAKRRVRDRSAWSVFPRQA
jgi:hypothetical protein